MSYNSLIPTDLTRVAELGFLGWSQTFGEPLKNKTANPVIYRNFQFGAVS